MTAEKKANKLARRRAQRRLWAQTEKAKTALRIRRKTYKQSEKGKATQRRYEEKKRRALLQEALANSKCASCGCRIAAPNHLTGWRTRKCEPCKALAPSKQPEAKRESLRKSYRNNPQKWKARHAVWVQKNKEWVRQHNRQWRAANFKTLPSYAAQLIVKNSTLSASAIPRAMRDVKLIQLQIHRTILNEKHN